MRSGEWKRRIKEKCGFYQPKADQPLAENVDFGIERKLNENIND